MAATRLIALHINKGKTVAQCLADRTDYSENAAKTEDGKYISAYACDAKTCDEEFLLSKRQYAITCIEADSFREKIWCLPASDLLGVGRATEKVLSGYGIHTIGELAATSDDFLKCRLGKNGLAIKKYANGLDDSPVMRSDYVSPVKSIGHGITTMQDLENNAEVWCVMLELVQEIGTKLRTHKKKAGGIAISIRNNELYTKEWQCRISIPTQSPTYLAKTAFALFAKNYQWEHPIRSVTVRAINLFEEDCPIQYDLFTDVKSLDRQERLDAAIEQMPMTER